VTRLFTIRTEELQEKKEEEDAKSQQKEKLLIKSYKNRIKDIEEEIKYFKSKAVKIIDLDDKGFIFLDTPNEGLFNNLMSLLGSVNSCVYIKIHSLVKYL
jgi:hypothetical protein